MHLGRPSLVLAAAALLPLLAGCNEFRIVPSCTDSVKNGAETDIDCGGDTCSRCALGRGCGDQADCSAGDCVAGFCAPPEVGIWTQANPSSRPPRRFQHTMSHDGTMTLLFGGADGIQHFGDTWQWDGTDWHPLSPANHPSNRAAASLVSDAVKHVTVLFGGRDFGGGLSDETWNWDGMDWRNLNPPTKPTPRQFLEMAFDTERGEAVLFGGLTPNADLGDTWIQRDGTWQTRMTPGPTSRHGAVMAYDEATKQSVLFGGAIGTGPAMPLNDTWTWDGTVWANATPANPVQSPSTRHEAAIAYNRTRKRVIIFGGNHEGTPLNDTWEWDGHVWRKPSGNGPPARRQAAMAFDPARQRVVLFGGTQDGVGSFDDTWEYHQIGNPCQSDAGCDTGHCVDGLCCETDKCDGCQACNLPSDPGRCTACGATCDAGACGP